MKRFHIAIGVTDIDRSVQDYSQRLGCEPSVIIPNEYALWRTSCINLSIRRVDGESGGLRHLGWEDASASSFSKTTDVNGIVWEKFAPEQQAEEILETWPQARYQP